MSEMGTLFLSSSSQHPMGELGAREAPTTADWPVPVRPTIPRTCACLAEHPDGQCPMACACLAEHPDGQCPMACACLAEQPDGQCLSGRPFRWPVPVWPSIPKASARCKRQSGRATRWPVPVWQTIPMASACLGEHPDGQCPMASASLGEHPDGHPSARYRNLSEEKSKTNSGWHCPTFPAVQGVCQLSREDVNLTTLDTKGTDIVSVQLTTYRAFGNVSRSFIVIETCVVEDYGSAIRPFCGKGQC